MSYKPWLKPTNEETDCVSWQWVRKTSSELTLGDAVVMLVGTGNEAYVVWKPRLTLHPCGVPAGRADLMPIRALPGRLCLAAKPEAA